MVSSFNCLGVLGELLFKFDKAACLEFAKAKKCICSFLDPPNKVENIVFDLIVFSLQIMGGASKFSFKNVKENCL